MLFNNKDRRKITIIFIFILIILGITALVKDSIEKLLSVYPSIVPKRIEIILTRWSTNETTEHKVDRIPSLKQIQNYTKLLRNNLGSTFFFHLLYSFF